MGNRIKTTNERLKLEHIEGPIPGSFMMDAYQRAGAEERARRIVLELGYELGPEEHRSYQEILKFIQSQED